jgi:predicted dehydrogenase
MIFGNSSNSRFDRLYIHGTKGSIRSDVEYNQAGSLSYEIFIQDGITQRKLEVPQNYSLEIEQLGRCILDGETPFVSSDFSIKNAKLMDAVLQKIGF